MAGERINPPLDDGRCYGCGKHISELRPFGGPGNPLDEDFTGALLVKIYRPMGGLMSTKQRRPYEKQRAAINPMDSLIH